MTMITSKLFSRLETLQKRGCNLKHSLLMELKPSSGRTWVGRMSRTCCATLFLAPLGFCIEACWIPPVEEGTGSLQKELARTERILSVTTHSDPSIWTQGFTFLRMVPTSCTTKKNSERDGLFHLPMTDGALWQNTPRVRPFTLMP